MTTTIIANWGLLKNPKRMYKLMKKYCKERESDTLSTYHLWKNAPEVFVSKMLKNVELEMIGNSDDIIFIVHDSLHMDRIDTYMKWFSNKKFYYFVESINFPLPYDGRQKEVINNASSNNRRLAKSKKTKVSIQEVEETALPQGGSDSLNV